MKAIAKNNLLGEAPRRSVFAFELYGQLRQSTAVAWSCLADLASSLHHLRFRLGVFADAKDWRVPGRVFSILIELFSMHGERAQSNRKKQSPGKSTAAS